MSDQKSIMASVLAELRYRKLVSSQTDMGNQLGYGKTYFSQVMNGSLPLTEKAIKEMETKFQIDRNYLKTGEGEMFKDSTAQPQVPEDLKDIVLLMANNVNTLIASVTTDRETVKKRFEKVDANFDKLYTSVESLQAFQGQAAHRLGLIEARLTKLIMNDPNSGAAVLGKKRRN